MNPRININLRKLQHNAATMVKLCNQFDIQVAAVTKGVCAHPRIAAALAAGGVQYLADSRIENFYRLQELPTEKIFLRLPMVSQALEVVKYSDISLNSELKTIKALNRAAEDLGKGHRIIIMIDLGDLREGIFHEEELRELLKEIKSLRHIQVAGVGTNLTCFGGVIPDEVNLGRLIDLSRVAESVLGYPMEIISGGNSSSIHLLLENRVPKGINQLRLGEAILLGTESARGNSIQDTYQDALQLVAEIIEIKEKPSVPIGVIGRDAFGNIPVFEERGTLKRAILAVGKQDTATHPVYPLDTSIQVLGGSSDHLIIDLTHCRHPYGVGDEVVFNLSYGAMLALMTSEYITKHFIESV